MREKKGKKCIEKYRSALFIVVFWGVAGVILFISGYLASQTNLSSMIMSFIGGA